MPLARIRRAPLHRNQLRPGRPQFHQRATAIEQDPARHLHLLLIVATMSIFVLSGSLLRSLGWQYDGTGSEIEKLHPGTFLILASFLACMAFDSTMRRRLITNAISDYSLLGFITIISLTAIFAIVARGAQIAPFVDTSGLLILVTLIFISLPKQPLLLLRKWLDVFFVINIGMMLAEYLLKRNFLTIYAGDMIYQGERYTELIRPAALFGAPLSAAGLLSIYAVVKLTYAPLTYSPASAWRLFISFMSIVAIFTTGSRVPLLLTLLTLAFYLLGEAHKTITTGKVNSAAVGWTIVSILGAMLVVPVLYQLGFFDLLLLRFTEDNGSALARDYALQMLYNTRPQDLWFGRPLAEIFAIQRSFQVIAIEISWINFILVCGYVLTVPLIVFFCLFWLRSIPRRCLPSAFFLGIYVIINSTATIGFWGKATGYAATVVIIFTFLRKDLYNIHSLHPRGQPDHASLRSRAERAYISQRRT